VNNLINTEFNFDGRDSVSEGVSIVRIESGIPSRKYISGKEILETHPNNALYPHFFGVKYPPITFRVTFTCEDEDMDDAKLYDLANWLITNEYKPFISYDNPSKVYYCMGISESDFYTNGSNQGYFEVDFRCRDGFGWTIPSIVEYDLSDITVPTTIQVINHSNVLDLYYPEMEIELQDTNMAVSLVNLSNDNYTFSFSGLTIGETITIDNQKRRIESDVSTNRFDKFNKNWFKLVKGVNNIQVTGKCIIKFKMQFPIFN
jgi:predicted phage tail component-like protein